MLNSKEVRKEGRKIQWEKEKANRKLTDLNFTTLVITFDVSGLNSLFKRGEIIILDQGGKPSYVQFLCDLL